MLTCGDAEVLSHDGQTSPAHPFEVALKHLGGPLLPDQRGAHSVFDDVMDAALTAMSGAEYVIVDLSNNRGGYDAISRRLASRFTDEAFAAYTTQVPGNGVPARAKQTRFD